MKCPPLEKSIQRRFYIVIILLKAVVTVVKIVSVALYNDGNKSISYDGLQQYKDGFITAVLHNITTVLRKFTYPLKIVPTVFINITTVPNQFGRPKPVNRPCYSWWEEWWVEMGEMVAGVFVRSKILEVSKCTVNFWGRCKV